MFRQARLARGVTQLSVARGAFRHGVSHCKVSRIERGVMRHVDAHALQLMAAVLHVPPRFLSAIDPAFGRKLRVTREATRCGLWRHPAQPPVNVADGAAAVRVHSSRA